MAVMVALVLAALLSQHPETLSLIGDPLYPLSLSKRARAQADDDLRTAHAAYEKAPNDVAAIVALAQAHLALGRLGDAIEILTHGLEVDRDDPRLLLERGRAYIALRKFDVAQRDLRKAAEKLPAAQCSLGLAQYVAGAFAPAQASYTHCDDPGVFKYLSARRAGAARLGSGQASRPGSGEGVERPQIDRGPASSEKPISLPGAVSKTAPQEPQAPSLVPAYFDAAELLIDGQLDAARDRLKEIVQKYRKDRWMEPAYIAAEADYARLYKPPRKHKKTNRH